MGSAYGTKPSVQPTRLGPVNVSTAVNCAFEVQHRAVARLNQALLFYQPMDGKSTPTVGELQQNELLTVREVAAYLRVGRVTVWRWCKEGTIPACRVGRNWRIPRDDFLDLLETSHPPGSVPPCDMFSEDNHRGQSVVKEQDATSCIDHPANDGKRRD